MDRMNLGELNDNKQVLIVDVPPKGVASVEEVSLEASPFYDIRIPAAELESLPERHEKVSDAYVRLHLECQEGDDPIVLRRKVRSILNHCLDVSFSGEAITPVLASAPSAPKNYAETVSDYLRQTYADDPDLPELEKRASQLLREVSNDTAAH
jgi:hypothetical protein